MSTRIPTSITATVDPKAIAQVASFFPASATLHELLQNARRASATSVEVSIERGRVTISDDGIGIGNPEHLLGFGRSDWTDEKVRRENPAGMGIFGLARYTDAVLRSRSEGAPGWEARLTPEVFRGRESAVVHRLSDDIPVGTTVSFCDHRTTGEHVANTARHYPIPVRLNGELMERRDWLEDAIHFEEFEGVLIGVGLSAHYGKWRTQRYPSINFHGIQPTGFSPVCIKSLDGLIWETRVDVQDCEEIELSLPARREVIQNAFLDELKLACERAIFRAMNVSGKRIDLSFADLTRARDMGFDLPEAEGLLSPWQPAEANYQSYRRQGQRVAVPDDPICICDRSPALQQTVFRAATLAGMADRLVEPDSALSGYGWYDSIPKVAEVGVFVVSGDSEKHVENSCKGETMEVEAIRLSLRSESDEEILSLPADIALLGEDMWAGEDPDIVITKDCGISVDDLVDIMMASFFEPSDEADADSYDTQREAWQEGFKTLAMRLLLSAEEEMSKTIEDLLTRHLSYRLQPGYSAEILLRYGERPNVMVKRDFAQKVGAAH